jgi:nitrogen fixation protein FixH
MMRGEFTGRRMAIVTFTFFGIVIAVNLFMAMMATSTFGGTVVDNSYVASQRFNGWLQEAREQAALQWDADMTLDPSGHLVTRSWSPAGPIVGAKVEAHATHPLGRAPEHRLALTPVADGLYRSTAALPSGRWIVRLSVRRDGHEARYLKEISP